MKGPQRQAQQTQHVACDEIAAAPASAFELDPPVLNDHQRVTPFGFLIHPGAAGSDGQHTNLERGRQHSVQERDLYRLVGVAQTANLNWALHMAVGRKAAKKLIGGNLTIWRQPMSFPSSVRLTREITERKHWDGATK